MYRFLLTPKWLLGHVIVATVAVLFVSLGFWQLDRHDQRTTRNALVSQRMSVPPADLDDVGGGDLAYRRVSLTGRYLADEEVLLTPRGWHGQAGHHVLTPLTTDDGDAVLVDRGWVPFELDSPPLAEAVPPTGEVRVTGLVFPDEPPVRFAPGLPADGELSSVSRVDVQRLQRQIDRTLKPYYVQLQEQDPPQDVDLPVAAEPPELSAGNHLSYAVQWFLFATVGLVGYPALIRRTALERRSGVPPPKVQRPAVDGMTP